MFEPIKHCIADSFTMGSEKCLSSVINVADHYYHESWNLVYELCKCIFVNIAHISRTCPGELKTAWQMPRGRMMRVASPRTFRIQEEVPKLRRTLGKSESTLLLIDARNSRVKLLNKLKLSLRWFYLFFTIYFSFIFVILFPYFYLKLTTFSQYLGDIDEEFTSKCLDLKSCIQNLEEGFLLQLEGMTRKLEENETKYNEDFRTTQEKILAINDKVVETRQIIGGASASSKVRFWIMISKRILY